MIEGTMALGIMLVAISKLCIVIWTGFIKLLRSFLILYIIYIIFIRYFGFDVEKVIKKAFPSWLWLESMLVACKDNDLLFSVS